jgi:hypothetical protein
MTNTTKRDAVDELAADIGTTFAPDDLPHIVAALSQQVASLTDTVRAMHEREQWYRRRQLATEEQRLAVLRQVTMPQLLDRIRQGGA